MILPLDIKYLNFWKPLLGFEFTGIAHVILKNSNFNG